MLYKFKSQACADVIMLQMNGEQMLTIIGKTHSPQGIITVVQIPAAIAALDAAIVRHEEAQSHRLESPQPEEVDIEDDGVMLRQRAAPFIELLSRSAAAEKDVVWGV